MNKLSLYNVVDGLHISNEWINWIPRHQKFQIPQHSPPFKSLQQSAKLKIKSQFWGWVKTWWVLATVESDASFSVYI